MNDLQILPLILDASLVVKTVMAVLLLLSLIGWALIFRLSGNLSSTIKDDTAFEHWFWSGEKLAKQYQAVSSDGERTGLSGVFFVAFSEFIKQQSITATKNDTSQALERQCRIAIGKDQQYLEQGLATLASIASVSPYIGLFGTVWGIMTAFIALGDAQSVSLATVAPSIAEALIATAMGLFAAIPASLGFNHFSAKANQLYERRALFCDELVGVILRQHQPSHPQTQQPNSPPIHSQY